MLLKCFMHRETNICTILDKMTKCNLIKIDAGLFVEKSINFC